MIPITYPFLPAAGQQNANLLMSNTSTGAATAAALASMGHPYAAALSNPNLASTLISPQATSCFEGVPIYLMPNSSLPFMMPKSDLPVSIASSPSSQPRVDTSKHFHIFVGDLSPEIDNKVLREAFTRFGDISETKVIRDLQTRKSKGYGFVTYVNKEDAERAIAEMHGQWLGKRTIRTNWATRKLGDHSSVGSSSNVTVDRIRSREDTDDHSSDDCGPPPAQKRQLKNPTLEEIMVQTSPLNTTIYIGRITSDTTGNELSQIFSKYGTILHVRVFGQQGYAFVKFDQKESAAQAILHENNREINGARIRCSWGKEGGTTTVSRHSSYNFGYDVASLTGSNLSLWDQCYPFSNYSSLQTYWQHQGLLAASAAGLLQNIGYNQ